MVIITTNGTLFSKNKKIFFHAKNKKIFFHAKNYFLMLVYFTPNIYYSKIKQ
jgi:hypothetical protein